jgi:hypothetical protein
MDVYSSDEDVELAILATGRAEREVIQCKCKKIKVCSWTVSYGNFKQNIISVSTFENT